MYTFGEKKEEQGLAVWQSPKYKESKAKAIEILESKKYGLEESDFWILMNKTKSGKMGYTGLILSHNGCLKINDTLDSKFRPSCVSLDKEGYNGSLVYTYCSDEQGIYEVGEVSKGNCTNSYPYAMAYKRMFDRVVLKLSKLAYAGIYGEDEADSFRDPVNDEGTKTEKADKPKAEKPATEKAETAENTDRLITEQEMAMIENLCKQFGKEVDGILGGLRKKGVEISSLKDMKYTDYMKVIRTFKKMSGEQNAGKTN